MNGMVSLTNSKSLGKSVYGEEFRVKADEYIKKQHPIVRGMHTVLRGFSYLNIALAAVFFAIAIYYTILWAATGSFTSLGAAAYLPDAWVNYGLSMSFVVFPWGLDSMLMRFFPAVIFPTAMYRSAKPVRFFTGIPAFFAGFGIMCAGAPGAVHIIGLGLDALRNLL